MAHACAGWKNDMKDEKLIKAVGFDRHFPARTWEDANRAFFDQLAPKYDRLNSVISLGQQGRYKRAAIRSLHLKTGMRVLDVCAGSGDMAIAMHRLCPGLQIDAVDYSEKMLGIARQRVERLGLTNVHIHQADALALPFSENTFDAVIMGFGLRNLKDIPAGIREMRRVLKPGGIFSSLDLGKPRAGLPRTLHHLYFERLMPWLGQVLFHRDEFNSFAYLSLSNQYFPLPERIMDLMRDAGFRDVSGAEYMLGGIARQSGTK
jgi:ubiquinone/menaquinone biosynthesis methyltransferase